VGPAQFLERWAKGDAALLDVRTRVESEYVDLPFAVHIPMEELPARWQELPRDVRLAW
jgi:rhodanese-related sulfurtransferase